MWTAMGTSAANTTQTVTMAAVSTKKHYVFAFEVALRAADAGNDMVIELRDGSTAKWKTVIGNGAPRGERIGIVFPKPIEMSINTAVNLVVPAGGTGCITEANIAGETK